MPSLSETASPVAPALVYLDTSALVKLVVNEPESDSLAHWLDDTPYSMLVTSVIGRVELVRACRRHSDQAAVAAVALLAELALVPMDATVLEIASTVGPETLRTLDALHLASAIGLRSRLQAFVAYDVRLVAAADHARLPVVAP